MIEDSLTEKIRKNPDGYIKIHSDEAIGLLGGHAFHCLISRGKGLTDENKLNLVKGRIKYRIYEGQARNLIYNEETHVQGCYEFVPSSFGRIEDAINYILRLKYKTGHEIKNFVDLGCGFGNTLILAYWISKTLGFSLENYVGIEHNKKACKVAEKFIREFVPWDDCEKFSIICGDITKPLPEVCRKDSFLFSYVPMHDQELLEALYNNVLDSIKSNCLLMETDAKSYYPHLIKKRGKKIGFVDTSDKISKYHSVWENRPYYKNKTGFFILN